MLLRSQYQYLNICIIYINSWYLLYLDTLSLRGQLTLFAVRYIRVGLVKV